MKRRTITRMSLLLMPLVAVRAWAHGDAHTQKTREAKPEQKPWGIAGTRHAVGRTLEVHMTDNMRFSPDRLTVRQGETIRLLIRNKGKMLHELVIGTRQELDEHAALMLRHPNMEHDEPYMAHVAPGKTGQIIWHFNRAGEFEFACLIAGHYQAGMVGKLIVTAP